jgi:hypothetical protein
MAITIVCGWVLPSIAVRDCGTAGLRDCGTAGLRDGQGLPLRLVRTAGMQQAGGGDAARRERHGDQHPGLSVVITSLVLPDGPGGRAGGRLRTVTAMPMAYGTSCARRGVVRVSLRDPGGGRPLVCRSRWRRVTRCRIRCRLPRWDARPEESTAPLARPPMS